MESIFHDGLKTGVVSLVDGFDEACHQLVMYLDHGLCRWAVGDVVDGDIFLFCEFRICRVSVVG